jgi:ethanolamine-phosphate cytidylyltransferase
MNLPLMNVHERVLSVLGCRYADDVVIDAPYEITLEMISSLKISEVLHGTTSDDQEYGEDDGERYKHARAANLLTVIESPSKFKVADIVQRIRRNQETFQAKFERKMQAENQFYKQKYGESNAHEAMSNSNGS